MATQLVQPNLDPVIYQPDDRGGVYALSDWAGYCLAYVQTAFRTGWAGARAWHAWEAAKKKHTNRNFPKGVYFPIWFSHWGTYGGVYGNFGHAAIAYVHANGTIQIWSSPASAKPYADVYNSIADVERIYSSSYVGWSEDLAGVQLIKLSNTPVEGGYAVDTIKSMYWRLLGREADAGGIKTYTAAANSKGWDFVYNDLKNSAEGQKDWQWRNPDRVRALEKNIADRDKQIADLQKALTNEKNKPPKEVIKEVEKIVEVPVEVIKEVPTPVDEQEIVANWLKRLWDSLFNR